VARDAFESPDDAGERVSVDDAERLDAERLGGRKQLIRRRCSAEE
jgi:hypothetical protein